MERLKLMLQGKCESIIRNQFNRLKKMATSLGVPPDNFQLIPGLNEVLKHPSFDQISNQKPPSQAVLPIRPVVICDWDGVVSDPWDNNYDSNLRRLLALRTIVCHSSEFHLWTMRVPADDNSLPWRKFLTNFFDRGAIAQFPFLTNTDLRKLYNFFQNSYRLGNRQTPIHLHPGANKVLGHKSPILDIAIEVLGRGKPLVIIGSSVSDRIQVKKLLEELERKHIDFANLYYFDTGHLVL